MKRALVLGGTIDARRVCADLAQGGWQVTLALKGLTARPVIPKGVMHRKGGFGGVEGLAGFIAEQRIDLLIDATHPFAGRMSWNAHGAAQMGGVTLLRVERPAWSRTTGDRWVEFDTLEKTAQRLANLPPRQVVLALGGQGAELFRACPQHRFLARVLDSSKTALATRYGHRWRGLQLQRFSGSPTLGQEVQAFARFGADLLVCRNAGGPLNAKILAARRLKLPVWMIARPPVPPVPTFASHCTLRTYLAAS